MKLLSHPPDIADGEQSASEYSCALAWLREFRQKAGRPLKVLHIGNIANNAYNNAKIQRKYGIEADVLCYDYYHIMSCPEWEEHSFEGVVDSNYPDWWLTSLNGPARPDWFVQGPADTCIRYLTAKNRNERLARGILRQQLVRDYWALLEGVAVVDGRTRGVNPPWTIRLLATAEEARSYSVRRRIIFSAPVFALVMLPTRFLISMCRVIYRLARALRRVDRERQNAPAETNLDEHKLGKPSRRDAVRDCITAAVSGSEASPTLRALGSLARRSGVSRQVCAARLQIRRLFRSFRPYGLRSLARRSGTPSRVSATRIQLAPPFRNFRRWCMGAYWRLAVYLQTLESVLSAAIASRRTRPKPKPVLQEAKLLLMRLSVLPAIIGRINDRYRVRNHVGGHSLSDELLKRYELHPLKNQVRDYTVHRAVRFSELLKHYDVVQGYSIDGFIPYVNGFKNFTCYEHGTLRNIPFEETLNGIICREAYKNAPAVFVTNSDVIPSVKRLGLAPSAVHYLPHAFDETRIAEFRRKNETARPESEIAEFFSPTRHHWMDNDPSLTKGNDTMLHGAAQLAAAGHRFRLTLCEWGKDLEDSKRLAIELGLSEHIHWIPTMGKRDLWLRYLRSHAVLDQFVLPALGGVGFEVLALGRRLITRIDRAQLTEFFGESPPVLNVATADEVATAMLRVIGDLEDRMQLGETGTRWIDSYHSSRRIVALQAAVYRDLVERSAPDLDIEPAPRLRAG